MACYNFVIEIFSVSLYCLDVFVFEINISDVSCGENCDGSLVFIGVGVGFWDYVLFDISGNFLYLAISIFGLDIIFGLCLGLYEILIVDNISNEICR